MPKKKFTPLEEMLITDKYKAGAWLKDLAEEYKCSVGCIVGITYRHGAQKPKYKRQSKKKRKENRYWNNKNRELEKYWDSVKPKTTIKAKSKYSIMPAPKGYKGKLTNLGNVFEHRLIMELYLREYRPDSTYLEEVAGKLYIKKIYMVHHINGDTVDNSLHNLQVMTRDDHNEFHDCFVKRSR